MPVREKYPGVAGTIITAELYTPGAGSMQGQKKEIYRDAASWNARRIVSSRFRFFPRSLYPTREADRM